ncbi:MAG: NAD(P)/FAD-dependent oxidoreductase [Treponema sp.]|nr:NAD(P)/FAD-dependent oxidoreductase [Treponema sp.]
MLYDAIIIGAGPTGSAAAKTLCGKGLSVLMLEAQKMPRYKSCSGCLIKRTMDLVQEYFSKPIPQSVMCAPFENKGMIFFDDKGKRYDFPQSGLNVWRSEFDYWLSQEAAASGAELRDQSRVTKIEQNESYVTVKIGEKKSATETARYVIDYEGAVSVVKKAVLGAQSSFITTYQTFNDGAIDLDPQYFYAYLQPEFSEYDAWFNVKDGMLVLGVAAKALDKIPAYYARFIKHLKEKHGLAITRQKMEDKWILPRITPDFKIDYAKGRVFFAGEAAGFLNPMGEGISAGMESARHLAVSMAENFSDPAKIEAAYRERAKPVWERMVRQWRFVGSITDTFSEMR